MHIYWEAELWQRSSLTPRKIQGSHHGKGTNKADKEKESVCVQRARRERERWGDLQNDYIGGSFWGKGAQSLGRKVQG